MKKHIQEFEDFLKEAADPNYFQETFYFTVLISMNKDTGGSRDETKNDIRALPEVLTVTLVEPEKGGVQRDVGTKYLSTLKIHVRRPKNVDKNYLMKRVVLRISGFRGVSVLRYKERQPKQRRKAFHGHGSYTKRVQNVQEGNYQQNPARKKNLRQAFSTYTKGGPQKKGGYPNTPEDPEWKSAPPGAPGGLEETQLDEAMKTAGDLPEDVVVVVRKGMDSSGFRVYFALNEDPKRPLKAGDLDRAEAGIDIYGVLRVSQGRNFPYEGVYIVSSSRVSDGYGPLLYDVAMETAGKSGLKPDTLTVSPDAAAVWRHYDTQRDDVDSELLVMDADQYHTVMPDDWAEKQEDNEHLAKVYFKGARSVSEELKDNDQLVEIYGETEEEPRTRTPNADLSRFDRLYEDVVISIGGSTGINKLMAFDVQPSLQQKIWNREDSVRPGVKAALLDIVEEFLEGLDLDLDTKDIIITGSIANYNWSRYSDIDIHILVDFEEVNDNTEMVKKFFDSVRSNWNKLHNIKVKGHEVEIYVQEEKEPHVSTGVYSLMNDRWLVKPKKVQPAIDRHTATKKMKALAREIDKLNNIFDNGQSEQAFEMAERLKNKIKRMRQSGLDRSGIYSPENLAFKMLRRSGDIEQLFSIYTQAYDKIYSLDQ
jgi:hypothetical protein